ncbi:MAG TPA: hypothetical protein VF981_05800 [Gemmatimonadaceae bacterium]
MRFPPWFSGMLLLVLTLGAGVAIGVALERRQHPVPYAGMESMQVLHRLRHELELDSTQMAAIAAILHRRQGAVDSTWHAMQPHVRATMDSALEEIARVLHPAQAERYHRILETMDPGRER